MYGSSDPSLSPFFSNPTPVHSHLSLPNLAAKEEWVSAHSPHSLRVKSFPRMSTRKSEKVTGNVVLISSPRPMALVSLCTAQLPRKQLFLCLWNSLRSWRSPLILYSSIEASSLTWKPTFTPITKTIDLLKLLSKHVDTSRPTVPFTTKLVHHVRFN